MIAINILNKAGKKVLPIKHKINKLKENQQITLQELSDANLKIKERILCKKLKIRDNIYRQLAFVNLIKRNKSIQRPIMTFNFPILMIFEQGSSQVFHLKIDPNQISRR